MPQPRSAPSPSASPVSAAATGRSASTAYFTAARGAGSNAPLEMTKWFDTNYHYLVPEIGPETVFALSSARFADQVAEARADGFTVRPVIVGPVTLLALAKASEAAPAGYRPLDRLDDLLPVYAALLAGLRRAGAEWVQLDEPALVSESLPYSTAELADAADRAYAALGVAAERPAILVAAPYAQLPAEAWTTLAAAPVEALAVDLVRGGVPSAAPGLETKTLVGGVIDGRNIWRGDLAGAWSTLDGLRRLGSAGVSAGTSTSLQHVPHDIADEPQLDARLASWLAFADQKVAQVVTLSRGLEHGPAAIEDAVAAASAAWEDRRTAPGVRDGDVRARASALTAGDFDRGDYETRRGAQEQSLALPLLPTTTIGSFPQTAEIRRARAQFAQGLLSPEEYEEFLRFEITAVVGLQEELEHRRARARRARAQRHGAVLRREPRRIRRHPQRMGAVLRLPCDPAVDPVGRCLSPRADHGRVGEVRAIPHREADEGDADRTRDDPGVVFRPRRPAARRDRRAGGARAARRDRRSGGCRHPDHPGRRAGAARAPPAEEGRPVAPTSTGRSARSASRRPVRRMRRRCTRTSATPSSTS